MVDISKFIPNTFARRLSIGDVVEIISGPFEFCDGCLAGEEQIMVQVRLPSDGMVIYNAEISDLCIITEEDAINDFRK